MILQETLRKHSWMEKHTMTAPYIVDPARLLKDALAESSPDLMRSLLQTMVNALLGA